MVGYCYDLSARLARLTAIVIWIVATTGATLGQQPQPQTPRAPATASITGRLLDTTTGQPIVGGVVVLREVASRDQRVVSTNDTGEFVIVDLPAATYALHASALGYVGRQYGQPHALEQGVPIELRNGETRRQVDVPLRPGGAIAGRVTTQDGQPLAFAEIEALRPRLERRLRVLVPVGRAESDARGEFHIGGLPPGHYYIAAIDPADEGTEDATGQIHWAQTFYPGTALPAAAVWVRLRSGATLTAVNFPLLNLSRVSVRGRLINSDDSTLSTGSIIMRRESNEGLGLGTTDVAVVRPDGTFEFANVSPGDYRLRASARTVRPGPPLFASFHLEVEGVDISNAVLFVNRGADLAGQVEIAGSATLPQPVMTDLWVSAPMADGSMGSGLTRSQVLQNGSFRLATPEGNRVIRVDGLPNPWSLEAVFYQGRNVIDVPFALRSGEKRERIRLVLTDRASRLVGVVQDEDGNAVTDLAIVALPVNSAFWRPGSRHVQLTYPDVSGRYEIVGLPAGVYLIAAVAGISTGDLYDPAILQEIAAAGTEALVEVGATTTVDLVLTFGGNQLAH
ncbi:MAG: carboxypeptidase regulatory-like domain-containing protein [Acidobacteria bacterium]|nr:carboxypeptidase regulatory-like domain-containing protein [Acidobacteriota bacterium]